MNPHGVEVVEQGVGHIGTLVLVHRPHPLGNPFSHRAVVAHNTATQQTATRAEAVALHMQWLWHSGQAEDHWREIWALADRQHDGVPELLSLQCVCPLGVECHAHTLAHAIAACRSARGQRQVIAKFEGPHRLLSNFHRSPVPYEGTWHPRRANTLGGEAHRAADQAPRRLGRHAGQGDARAARAQVRVARQR